MVSVSQKAFAVLMLVVSGMIGCDRPVAVYDEDEFAAEILLANVLHQPRLIRPKNGSTSRSVEVTLRWSRIPSATNYTVQVSRDTLFNNPLLSAEADTTLYRTPPLFGSLFYWRVRSNKGLLTSDWSDRNLFYVKAE